MEQTKVEDSPNSSAYTEMDPEVSFSKNTLLLKLMCQFFQRKKFLEEAIQSMTVDVMEELQKALSILDNPKDFSEEDEIEALNSIRDNIDSIDFSNNFIKIGGSKKLLEKVESKSNQIQSTAIYTIAELSQNNPYGQQHFLDLNVLDTLIPLVNHESEEVASSSLHCISSLVRQFEPACAAFIEKNGLECVVDCLGSQHPKVFTKACFLISNLSSEHDGVGGMYFSQIVQFDSKHFFYSDEFVKLGAVEKLAKCLDSVTGFEIKIESVLLALNTLTQSSKGKQSCKKTQIYPQLISIIENNAEKPECEVIICDFSNFDNKFGILGNATVLKELDKLLQC